MTTTDILGLRLPAETEYYSLANHWNYNSTKLEEYAESLTGSTGIVTGLQAAVGALAGGVHLRGAVNYYADLPATPSEGDAYTVLYTGTSGTTPLGVEYAWASYNNTPQWVPIGVDPSVYARQADLEAVRAALIEQIDNGPKNIADGRHADTTTGGVAFDFADDGTCTATGTASDHKATSAIMLTVCTFTPEADKQYVASGCPFSGSNNTFAMRVTTASDSTIVWETGTGAIFTPSSSDPLTIKFSIKTGTVVDGLAFRPMICSKAAWDISQAFVPYRPSWDAMWAAIQALQA